MNPTSNLMLSFPHMIYCGYPQRRLTTQTQSQKNDLERTIPHCWDLLTQQQCMCRNETLYHTRKSWKGRKKFALLSLMSTYLATLLSDIICALIKEKRVWCCLLISLSWKKQLLCQASFWQVAAVVNTNTFSLHTFSGAQSIN